MKYKKVLVTGGAGFIGSHLVEELLKNNVRVLVVDNLLTGKKTNLDSILPKTGYQKLSYKNLNIFKQLNMNYHSLLK